MLHSLTQTIYTVTKVYPPKTNADLRSLVDHIVSSELDIHHKQSLIYYILKDCRSAPEAATLFARSCHLPEIYRFVIEGLWNMDRLDFRVGYLVYGDGEPSLTTLSTARNRIPRRAFPHSYLPR